MKKNEIAIGSTYTAKITNRVVPVRIDATNPHSGWDATNLATGKRVRIKSAAKLRGVYRDTAKAEPAAKAAMPTNATRANTAATVAKGETKAGTKATPASNATRAKHAAKPKRISGLDLAAKVLAEAKEPLQAKTIAERAIAAGWKTNGKTPHATLYAAITREIAKKGNDARFKKIDRGHFAINVTTG